MFTKYLVLHHNALFLGWAKQQDLFYAASLNRDRTVVVFDFTRAIPESVKVSEVFSSIESIKNGVYFFGKYESLPVVTTPPHVICFSNMLPSFPGAFSNDR